MALSLLCSAAVVRRAQQVGAPALFRLVICLALSLYSAGVLRAEDRTTEDTGAFVADGFLNESDTRYQARLLDLVSLDAASRRAFVESLVAKATPLQLREVAENLDRIQMDFRQTPVSYGSVLGGMRLPTALAIVLNTHIVLQGFNGAFVAPENREAFAMAVDQARGFFGLLVGYAGVKDLGIFSRELPMQRDHSRAEAGLKRTIGELRAAIEARQQGQALPSPQPQEPAAPPDSSPEARQVQESLQARFATWLSDHPENARALIKASFDLEDDFNERIVATHRLSEPAKWTLFGSTIYTFMWSALTSLGRDPTLIDWHLFGQNIDQFVREFWLHYGNTVGIATLGAAALSYFATLPWRSWRRWRTRRETPKLSLDQWNLIRRAAIAAAAEAERRPEGAPLPAPATEPRTARELLEETAREMAARKVEPHAPRNLFYRCVSFLADLAGRPLSR